MRALMLAATLTEGDAVSNETFFMAELLRKSGFECDIYAENNEKAVRNRLCGISEIKAKHYDLAIYHVSIASDVCSLFISLNIPAKIIVYHNITPAHFFDVSSPLYKLCSDGRKQLNLLKDYADTAICDSEYNRAELLRLGCKNTCVLPILADFYALTSLDPPQKMNYKLKSDSKNILFVGRISPNKCQHDIIKTFRLYHDKIEPNSQLFLIGKYHPDDAYYRFVRSLADKNVIFTGGISDAELAHFYRNSAVFLSMSEHEGFGVPLVEAMAFGTPVLAFDSSAVSETLNGGGIIFSEKNYPFVAEMMDMLACDADLRRKILAAQHKAMRKYDLEKNANEFLKLVKMAVN